MEINRKLKAEALFQIILLVFGIVAFSYAIGSSVGIVSGSDKGAGEETSQKCTEGAKQCIMSYQEECQDGKMKIIGLCGSTNNYNFENFQTPASDIYMPTNNINDKKITWNQIQGLYEMENIGEKAYHKLKGLFGEKQELSLKTVKDALTSEEEKKALLKFLAGGVAKQTKQIMGIEEFDKIEKYLSDDLKAKIAEKVDLTKTREIDINELGLTKDELAQIDYAKQSYFFKLIPKRSLGGFIYGGTKHIFTNAGVAYGIYQGISYLGKILKVDSNIQRAFDNAGKTAAGTYFITKTGQDIIKEAVKSGVAKAGGKIATFAASKLGVVLLSSGFLWGTLGATILISVLTFRNQRYQQIDYQCNAWQPQTGGDDCEKCNNQGLIPCTEYQCKSLGQSCELVNKGTTNEKCAYTNRNDAEYPIIKPWTNALLNDKYRYSPIGTISPSDRGVSIQYTSTDGCVPAFTPFSFGVTLNEPARCKISPVRTDSFDSMGNLFMSGGMLDYNHSYALSMPSPDALESENITIENGGTYELYVRCEDGNGNSNPANFVFKYCIDKGPDVTNPMIVSTSILNGWPIAYGTNSTNLSVYVNEPAECRWSHLNQSYENMKNQMQCNTKLTDINSYMLYTCKTTLDGLKSKKENKFYFRCKDQPELAGTPRESDRNTNTESYPFSLIGTQRLVLDSASPNNTIIKGASSPIKVTLTAETSAGYKNGDSICYYKPVGAGDYIEFYNTSSYTHSQDLWLPEGNYSYSIKCVDLGGNKDEKTINFSVETDTTPPVIVRAYHSGDEKYLKLITDEEATCVYNTASNVGCNYNFDEGKPMTDLDKTEHYTEWNSNVNFYVKCKDKGGMEPGPNQCSMIIRPFEI